MTVSGIYAVVSTAQLARAHEWYARLFGRTSDLHPMNEVHEWHFANGGVQLVLDAERAGGSMLTVVVADLDTAREEIETRDLFLGPAAGGDFATIAQINDPDGNLIVVAAATEHVRAHAQGGMAGVDRRGAEAAVQRYHAKPDDGR